MRFIPILLLIATIAAPVSARDNDRIEIKSGPNGPYCVPFDDPRCKSHFNIESERRYERRQMEKRLEALERREQQDRRELERRRYDYDDERGYDRERR